jgi:D-alanyl-D-alanine carboxypeptidase (penicillin-binding protein 5/6)
MKKLSRRLDPGPRRRLSHHRADPPFDTPAPIAYLEDLSSGAVLYAKDADRRIPPASMAKMMTVYVAFDLIKQGKLKLSDTARSAPETWKKWHSQGSTMFLAVGEKPRVEDLLNGIVTLSGNDACVVLAEKIAGTEEAFVNLMNQQARSWASPTASSARRTAGPTRAVPS